MAPYPSTLAWKIPWMEEPGGLWSMGSLRVRHDWATSLSHIGEGNGNPLQCSCLEKSRDGGAWWAAIYGITKSWTLLKWLRSSSSRQHKGYSLLSLAIWCKDSAFPPHPFRWVSNMGKEQWQMILLGSHLGTLGVWRGHKCDSWSFLTGNLILWSIPIVWNLCPKRTE